MIPDSRFLDTIVAPATPAGRSAIALVRVSGPRASAILFALAPALRRPLCPRRPRLVRLAGSRGDAIDSALATFFPGPASATGEDVAELSVHGSPAVVERVLEAAVAAGARMARPGEFTERAFRAGKVDLVRAEAVRELIEAKTPAAARASARRLDGGLSRRLAGIRDELLAATASLEATIDFAEDVGDAVDASVGRALGRAAEELSRLAASYETGRLLAQGCRVAILGPPNAGKSTVFNALLGAARAIVTDVPGTTRDTIEGVVDIRGIPVTLVDTAGLRETEDVVERIGVARARDEARFADAVLYVFDAAVGFTAEDAAAVGALDAGRPRAIVANKVDRIAEQRQAAPGPAGAEPLCAIAADAGARLGALLERMVAKDLSTEETSEVLGSLRQRDLVARALAAADDARAAVDGGVSPEYAATHCHAALDALADLVGETTSEDVLTRLFATFCIGK